MTFRSFFGAAVLFGASGIAIGQETISLSRQDHQSFVILAYAPSPQNCRGVALISPGAGGSEQGYRYLGVSMASLGYLAVVMGHPESGRRALREAVRGNGLRAGLAELITEPEAYRGRFMDISAAKQWAQSRCASNESILIGHSMGAATVLMEAGARNKVGMTGAKTFSAYIALSPQGAGILFPENAWSNITRPVFLLTGTRDTELGNLSWQTRTEPFKSMPVGCKWLGVVDGATHMNFAGNGASRNAEELTTKAIAAFLDGVHRGDCSVLTQFNGITIDTK